jgi:ketol-acid reductoisomerase
MAEARMFYQNDCDLNLLQGKKIAIIGYGSQGHAHALNLKDSGCDVFVGLYEGSKSKAKAEAQGLKVYPVAEAAKMADIIMILIPDELQADMYHKDIEPNLKDGDMLMFAHGFNINYKLIVPPKGVDVTMIAPKAPGHTVRSEYQAGKGTPCLVAVEQDATGKALDLALAYGAGLAQQEPVFLRQHSRQRQRQTSSVSRQFFAAVFAHLCRQVLKHSAKQVMTREMHTSSVFMR